MNNQIGSKGLTRLLYILLFAFSLGIGNFERYIIFAILLIYLYENLKSNGRLKLYSKSPVVPLAIWGIIYFALFSLDENNLITGLVYYFIGPVLLWLIGRDISDDYNENGNLLIVLMVISGTLLHGILNIVSSINGGYFLNNAEYIHDFWSGRMVSRTIVGMYMTPFVCASIPILFLWDKNFSALIKIILLGGTITALVLSIYVGNRALLVISVLVLILSILFGIRVSKNKKRTVVGIVAGLILLAIAFSGDIFNISEFFSNSFLSKRSTDLMSDGRWAVYSNVFSHFSDYFFGWISSGGETGSIGLKWAHNIWLDVYIYAGFVPTVFFVTFTIRVIRNSLKLVKRPNKSSTLRLVSVIITLGILLNWAVEPILVANPYYFASCCFVFGAIEKWCHMSNRREMLEGR